MASTLPSPTALVTPFVSNASVQVAGVNLTRSALYVFNPSASITIWVTPLGNTAAVLGAGCVAVQPQQGLYFGPPTMGQWTNGMNAIASSAGSNVLCILEFYQ
jgi:hypothetical protein